MFFVGSDTLFVGLDRSQVYFLRLKVYPEGTFYPSVEVFCLFVGAFFLIVKTFCLIVEAFNLIVGAFFLIVKTFCLIVEAFNLNGGIFCLNGGTFCLNGGTFNLIAGIFCLNGGTSASFRYTSGSKKGSCRRF